MKQLQNIVDLDPLDDCIGNHIIFIAAMGFEDRALAFARLISTKKLNGTVLSIKYAHAKGVNREKEFCKLFENKINWKQKSIKYSSIKSHEFEPDFIESLKNLNLTTSVIIIDISAMSKFLILVVLICVLQRGYEARIIMTTARTYAPTKAEFESRMAKEGEHIKAFAGQPSSGVSAILRSSCMTSTRMQGQPTCAVAFTSFNEELIRHAIGTLNPRQLLLINGMPPTIENSWRAEATEFIHSKLIEEYSSDNKKSHSTGLLERTVSTLNYIETVELLEKIHLEYGLFERMIYFATGSKMQTVALAIHKLQHSDAHIEYPTPDSYYFKEYSKDIGDTFWVEVKISNNL